MADKELRNYALELKERVEYIHSLVESAGAEGIVYGNSGGKDSALVGILCKMACDNTVGIIMPCGSKRNFEVDKKDALEVAEHYGIHTRIVDLTPVREAEVEQLKTVVPLTQMAVANIAPRLRMTTLYAIARSENLLVAGTGNRSEGYMGYFTKWGDGAFDFNPISDLTVTEIYQFLKWLSAPSCVIEKAPSAALYDGQTDETEMGITYEAIDRFLLTGEAEERDARIMRRYHRNSEHKRLPVSTFEAYKKEKEEKAN